MTALRHTVLPVPRHPKRTHRTTGDDVLDYFRDEVVWPVEILLKNPPLERRDHRCLCLSECGQLPSRVLSALHDLCPIDPGVGGASFLVNHLAAHWQYRGQVRVGQSLHARPEFGLGPPGDMAEELVNPETQKILRIRPLADEQTTPGDLDAFLLEA